MPPGDTLLLKTTPPPTILSTLPLSEKFEHSFLRENLNSPLTKEGAPNY